MAITYFVINQFRIFKSSQHDSVNMVNTVLSQKVWFPLYLPLLYGPLGFQEIFWGLTCLIDWVFKYAWWHVCWNGVQSLRYNSMQTHLSGTDVWNMPCVHLWIEEGHVLRPSHKEHKNTIDNPFGLWVKICLSSCECVQASPVFK